MTVLVPREETLPVWQEAETKSPDTGVLHALVPVLEPKGPKYSPLTHSVVTN
jgi:hypothetical protein